MFQDVVQLIQGKKRTGRKPEDVELWSTEGLYGSLLWKVYHWQSPHLKSHILQTVINLVILAIQIYYISNKETAASVLWSVLTQFLRITTICFQIVVFREWPFVTWLRACIGRVIIIFEITSETVKSCFMTWTKNKTCTSWLITSLIAITHVIYTSFLFNKIRYTRCPQ